MTISYSCDNNLPCSAQGTPGCACSSQTWPSSWPPSSHLSCSLRAACQAACLRMLVYKCKRLHAPAAQACPMSCVPSPSATAIHPSRYARVHAVPTHKYGMRAEHIPCILHRIAAQPQQHATKELPDEGRPLKVWSAIVRDGSKGCTHSPLKYSAFARTVL